MASRFFGLRLKPGEKHGLEPRHKGSVYITQAALLTKAGAAANSKKPMVVCCQIGKRGPKFTLCTLRGHTREQIQLNVRFDMDEVNSIILTAMGEGSCVDLTGYIKLEDEEESEEEDGDDEEEEVEEAKKTTTKKGKTRKKRVREEMEDDDNDEEEEEEEEQEEEEEEEPEPTPEPKNKKSKKQKKEKKTYEIQKMRGGVQAQEIKMGSGREAGKGDTVQVRYKGLLQDGTEFDSNMPRGRPFSFTIGEGLVIKGWDVGVVGMKVGGRRNLLIPSNMAYGKKGSPPTIPRNATLLFYIELLAVM